ncbi:unnamed protein product [Mytilus coruscus]|uniref:Uncharacterized protein n=1 Tax=Mytilus coruscus TaxID=42192 RepID=A0A6J8EBB2_MYTCO|nr:unnamed protein product [Mytilus coruscus]
MPEEEVRLMLREVGPKSINKAENITVRLEALRVAYRQKGRNIGVSFDKAQNSVNCARVSSESELPENCGLEESERRKPPCHPLKWARAIQIVCPVWTNVITAHAATTKKSESVVRVITKDNNSVTVGLPMSKSPSVMEEIDFNDDQCRSKLPIEVVQKEALTDEKCVAPTNLIAQI